MVTPCVMHTMLVDKANLPPSVAPDAQPPPADPAATQPDEAPQVTSEPETGQEEKDEEVQEEDKREDAQEENASVTDRTNTIPEISVQDEGDKTVTSGGDEVTQSEEIETTADGAATEKPEPPDSSIATSRSEAPTVEEVTADHPEVKAIVDAAIKQVEEQPITLPAETYVEVMEAAIQECEKELRRDNQTGPLNGGWILDNFPRSREQWGVLIEKGGPLPDDVICLKDESENGDYLIKRWYRDNHESIDEKAQQRKQAEMIEKQRKEEEVRRKEEQERKAAEEAAKRAAEEEQRRRLEEGEESELADEEEGAEVAEEERDALRAEEQDAASSSESATPAPTVSAEAAESEPAKTDTPSPAILNEDKMPPEGPELTAQRELRKAFEAEWPSSAAMLTGSTPIEPITIEVGSKNEEGVFAGKSYEEIQTETITALEKSLQYQAWEVTGVDLDEEAEDMEADAVEAGEEAEEGEEEEEDKNRSQKKALGDTNYFCPVMLKEKHVLWPGDPEKSVKYREKTYYLSTVENKEKFLADPQTYLPVDKPFSPPPIRLLILGPKGSGKTLHGRDLARKLKLFHIQFHERLQELVIGKTKHKGKLGPEHDEQRKEDEEAEKMYDLADLEDVAAITGPDGQPINPDQPKVDSNASLEKETAAAANEEDKKEEEEEENWTEDESSIKAYLENEDPLPNDLLEKIVGEWWNQEPYKSTGFVLEGFPRTGDEAEFMCNAGLFPDGAIILALEDSDVIARLLPPRLEKWHKRRAMVLEKKEKRKQLKQKKREAEMAKRREVLIKERDEKRAERRANREAERDSDEEYNSEEEGEEEEEEDIEELLALEFEEEEEEEEEELEPEEDAVDQMRNKLEEVYDKDTNSLAVVQEKFEDFLVPRIELDASKKPHIVRYLMSKRLKKIVSCRHSLFERVYPITEKLAARMLQIGYKHPSRFGKWDPILLAEGDCVQPMQGLGYPSFPAIYRQHIYFMFSAQNREMFINDPMMYLRLPSPKPVVPIRMAIIGPPKSGKTTLARRFVEEYGLMRLSIGEAVRQIIELQPNSDLCRQINSYLFKGQVIPDELSVQCLEMALMDMRSQTRGFILDGFPITKKQVDLMTERSLIPVRVIELQLDSKEVVTRATKDRYAPDRMQAVHDSAQILAIKLAAWKKEIALVRQWYQTEHDNLVNLDGERSKWWVWNRATEVAKESVIQIQTYLQMIADGKAASIANMCITPSEFEVRLGDFGQYCPVSLADKGELVDCSVDRKLKHAAEYRGHYYKMGSKEDLEQFLSEPERYIPPLAPRKLPPPEMLPRRRTAAEAKRMFPKPIELQGYCPVTFLDGKLRYEAIVQGDSQLVVEYREKLYYFESEKKLDKFMRLPEKYWDLVLPHKLPPKREPLLMTSLPMLGYMEQTVASSIIKALTATGNFKPKYPFLSPTRSALIYVAYYLKAYNPKSSDYVRRKFKRKLMKFEETCELIRYLGDNMTKRYRAPVTRPIDFDFKLEAFMQLKGKEPTTSWVA